MLASLTFAVWHQLILASLAFCCVAFAPANAVAQSDSLPAWNGGAVKKSIAGFVARVATPGGADFVKIEQRIATFGNDGTLLGAEGLAVVDMKRDWKTVFPSEGKNQ